MDTERLEASKEPEVSGACAAERSGMTRVVGATALIVGAIFTIYSFAIAYYGTPFVGEGSRLSVSFLVGGGAFPLLWLAWRRLGRTGRIYVAIVATCNALQLASSINWVMNV